MDDLISRQAAIDLVRDVCNAILNECSCHYDSEVEDEVYDDIHEVDTILKCNKAIRKSLMDLPSAQPERKNGTWEIYVISQFDGEGCRCSECGFEGAPYWNFCPECGADMRGDDHETD